jgi:iron complex outermembrane receptor protein
VFDPAARADIADEATELAEVVVTGSLIRGVADGPSPVVTVTRDDIDRDGHATVAQALAALPQNFGGTANEGALQNGADRSASNGGFASGVNLRGLGSDATLVLINGRRLSGTGAFGDFADVSTVPTSAIARIDVLLDGASALYGSDAVGGVVNIILRRDYDGVETRARYGQTSDGAAREYQFGQTIGKLWSGGGLIGSYEYYDRGALATADRPLAGNADLRSLGGSDRRLNYANPGNLVVYNAAVGGYVSAFAIPMGQNGRTLTPGDFLAGQTNRSNQRQGMNVLPHQQRHSIYLSGHQDLGSRLTVSADARWGRREWDTVSAPIVTLITANAANPYYVSPTGAASHLIAYSFLDELPNPVLSGDAESLGLSLGADLELAGDWRLSGYAAYASDESENRASGVLNSVFLREALGTLADNPATPFSAARDGYFNPFSDGGSSPQGVLDFVSSGWNYTRGKTEVRSANLQLDGTLWTLPGGALKLAAGLSMRREDFSRASGNLTGAVIPTIGVPAEFDREVFSAFAEVRAPLIGEANARPGIRRFELSLAARYEEYDDIGSTLNPKVGLVWEATESFLFRANYGSSFRAPALREIHDAARQSPTFLTRGAGTTLSLILYGGNPDLAPEEADTWTAGVEYRPSAIEGLRLGLNWFRTDFDQRIGQPALNSVSTVLTDPALASFVRLINPVTSNEDRALIQSLLDLPSTVTGGYPATAFGAIVDARYVNTTKVEVEGLDASFDYPFELRGAALQLSANLSYLARFDSQNTPTAPVVSTLDRPNEPIGLRGRSTLRWSRGSWSASASTNFVDSYRDVNGDRIGSWVTADAQLLFAPERGLFAGSTIALNVQNGFDQDPPFWDGPEGIAYDAANANVLGRFVSIQLTKAW